MDGAKPGGFAGLASVIRRAGIVGSLFLVVFGTAAVLPRGSRELIDREGILEILVADDFERGSSQLLYSLIADDGTGTALRFAGERPDLVSGMRVRVSGSSSGQAVLVEEIQILNRPVAPILAISGNSSVIVP